MGVASALVFGVDISARLKEAESRHSRIRTKTDQRGSLFYSKRSLVQAAIAKLSKVDLVADIGAVDSFSSASGKV